jgi:hypothetical protein
MDISSADAQVWDGLIPDPAAATPPAQAGSDRSAEPSEAEQQSDC